MPILNGSIGMAGPVVEISVAVTESRRDRFQAHGFPIPAPVRIQALLDSGSALTGFDYRVFQQLDLTPFTTRFILTTSTGQTPHLCREHLIQLSILHPAGDLVLADWLVIDAEFTPGDVVQGVIGRDVLDQCLFVYNGRQGVFSLAF